MRREVVERCWVVMGWDAIQFCCVSTKDYSISIPDPSDPRSLTISLVACCVSANFFLCATASTSGATAKELPACSRIVAHGFALKAGCAMTAGIRAAFDDLGSG